MGGRREGRGGEREGREKGRVTCSKVVGGIDAPAIQHASLSLWNQLSVSLRQPHTSLSTPDSPLPTPSPSMTPSLFHSQLKNYLLQESFPPQTLSSFLRTDFMAPVLLGIPVFWF